MWTEYRANPKHEAWGGNIPTSLWRTDGSIWQSCYADGQWGWGLNWDAEVESGALIPVEDSYTDADLAMALQLAGLMAPTKSDGWIEVAESELNFPIAHWLRSCVERELLSRGVQ